MSNVAKLKKRALEYEQKKQFDKALETYVQILDGLDEHVDEADVALYNRVGDLLLRRGDVSEAVDHYERAVDLYTEGGFFNNAIALCNKILRNAPGRNSIYYKLGKISARKGFINDAKQNFLEYADRMQKSGQLEEAFRALKEFADLCPDQDDIRLMLADQLVRKDRKGEAVEQLQSLYEKYSAEGRTREARATVDRIKAIDPTLEPKASVSKPTPKAGDLIFLDVDYDGPSASGSRKGIRPGGPSVVGELPDEESGTRAPRDDAVAAPAPIASAEPATPAEPAIVEERAAEQQIVVPDIVPDLDVPLIDVDESTPATIEPLEGLSHGAMVPSDAADDSPQIVSHVDSGLITGFEETTLGEIEESDARDVAPLAELDRIVDFEPEAETLIVSAPEPLTLEGGPADDLVPLVADGQAVVESALDDSSPGLPIDDLPMLDVPVEEETIGAELTFIAPGPDDAPAEDERAHDESPAAAHAGLDVDFDLHIEQDSTENTFIVEPDLPEVAEIHQPIAAHEPSPVERLRLAVAREPTDWAMRRRLAEALLEDGDRAGGLAELEATMLGLERTGDLAGASTISEELIRVEPGSVRHHQKRVEYAVRGGEKGRLVDAYLSLAECLLVSGQLDKSRAVYARVYELAPDDPRAAAALAALGVPVEPPVVEPPPSVRAPAREAAPVAPAAKPVDLGRRGAPPQPPRDVPVEPPRRESFVNLADWLREEEPPPQPEAASHALNGGATTTQKRQVDFDEMLTLFKQGVAQNVDETDHESHYDLGVAYKEMGLLDEAISEFQKALRGTDQRVRTCEALGQCFVEKRQFEVALTILARALADNDDDHTLIGVLYLLGCASEALGRLDDAQRYYERVFAVDIRFRDVGERLAAVERRTR